MFSVCLAQDRSAADFPVLVPDYNISSSEPSKAHTVLNLIRPINPPTLSSFELSTSRFILFSNLSSEEEDMVDMHQPDYVNVNGFCHDAKIIWGDADPTAHFYVSAGN